MSPTLEAEGKSEREGGWNCGFDLASFRSASGQAGRSCEGSLFSIARHIETCGHDAQE